jgi:phytoene/squalene synthetase
MSLEACRALVETADPDRFVVSVSATEAAQRILWPLYAFNVEVTRAPWVTQEPMIAEIRLQWWRDSLAEIREGQQVRSHAVTVPLAQVLDAEGSMVLDKLVEARAWDIYDDPFPDRASFDAYIDATYGNLLWSAARLIAPEADQTLIRHFAYGCGVAAMLRATARLRSLGKQPVPGGTVEAFESLAEAGLQRFQSATRARHSLPKSLEPILMTGWQVKPTLQAVSSQPRRVFEQGIAQSEFARRARLLKLSFAGWWR